MTRWTFTTKLTAGFGTLLAIMIAMSVVAISSLRSVTADKDLVINEYATAISSAQELLINVEQRATAFRGYLLTGDETHVANVQAERGDYARARTAIAIHSTEQKQLLARIDEADRAYRDITDRQLERARTKRDDPALIEAFKTESVPLQRALRARIEEFIKAEGELLAKVRDASTASAGSASWTIGFASVLVVAVAFGVALYLIRDLNRQIGGAVVHMQSSSTELQASANQMSTCAAEQAQQVAEISTTTEELLSASRQISEGARRVAEVATNTEAATRGGTDTVARGKSSVDTVKEQVDQVVAQMLELGRKSREIGGVLEIIKELSEQTNILAVNATIEAKGAGEVGLRFAVVADEIRKLADRTSGSTREIRSLIEEIRAEVNTTVVTTETGSKAVEEASRQFARVADSFGEIAQLVGSTARAGKEIELSINHQTTAVEQVALAIRDVATAAKESDASARQTLETATTLAKVASSLLGMVKNG